MPPLEHGWQQASSLRKSKVCLRTYGFLTPPHDPYLSELAFSCKMQKWITYPTLQNNYRATPPPPKWINLTSDEWQGWKEGWNMQLLTQKEFS